MVVLATVWKYGRKYGTRERETVIDIEAVKNGRQRRGRKRPDYCNEVFGHYCLIYGQIEAFPL